MTVRPAYGNCLLGAIVLWWRLGGEGRLVVLGPTRKHWFPHFMVRTRDGWYYHFSSLKKAAGGWAVLEGPAGAVLFRGQYVRQSRLRARRSDRHPVPLRGLTVRACASAS